MKEERFLTASENANVSPSNRFAMTETNSRLMMRYQENTVSDMIFLFSSFSNSSKNNFLMIGYDWTLLLDCYL